MIRVGFLVRWTISSQTYSSQIPFSLHLYRYVANHIKIHMMAKFKLSNSNNRPQEIDEAARRRMVKRLYIPLPGGEARKQIICNLLKDQNYSLSEDDFNKLMQRSEGVPDNLLYSYSKLWSLPHLNDVFSLFKYKIGVNRNQSSL